MESTGCVSLRSLLFPLSLFLAEVSLTAFCYAWPVFLLVYSNKTGKMNIKVLSYYWYSRFLISAKGKLQSGVAS